MKRLQSHGSRRLLRGALAFVLTCGVGRGVVATLVVDRALAWQNSSLESAQRSIRAVLERAGDQAAAELSRVGTDSVEPLWRLVDSGQWPQEPGDSGRPARVSEAQMATLLGALSKLRDPHVLARVQQTLAIAENNAADRVVALHVLAQIGKAEDLPLVLDLASVPGGRLQKSMDYWLGQAVIGILSRHGGGYHTLAEAWELHVTPDLETTVLQALREVPTFECLALLMQRVRLGGPPHSEALSSLYRLAADLPTLPANLNLTPIQNLLAHRDATLRSKAAMCLGSLDDLESVDPLIELLSDESKSVRNSANLALRRLTGRGFQADPARWIAWRSGEDAWWAKSGRAALEQLQSMDQTLSLAAAFQLSQHRNFANEFVPELVQGLQDGSPKVQVALCQALAQTGHRSAVPSLIQQLSNRNPSVQAAAKAALGTITGRKAEDIRAWVSQP